MHTGLPSKTRVSFTAYTLNERLLKFQLFTLLFSFAVEYISFPLMILGKEIGLRSG